ncbi:hypothetical protein IAT38_006148 [Cryptococcus sp. DSM 104549]
MSSSTLRPHQPSHSPTSSVSSQNTTPTSPYFSQYSHHPTIRHPYATATPKAQPPPSVASYSTNSSFNHPSRSSSPPLYRAPAGVSFPDYLRSWRDPQIRELLDTVECAHYAPLFKRHNVDGRVLLDMDKPALTEIGITKVGDKVKIARVISDLKKKVADAKKPPVQLRLNGNATPPIESVEHFLPPPPAPAHRSSSSSRLARTANGAAATARRLNSSRPPPLDLQQYTSSRQLPQAYQHTLTSASSVNRSTTTPRAIPQVHAQPAVDHHAQNYRPEFSSSTSSNHLSSSVPAPGSRSNNLNLRAPPPRDAGRRSPSPVNSSGGDPSQFVDRPLPPAPSGQSSAAEYANSMREAYHRQTEGGGRSTPVWSQGEGHYGLPKGPAPAVNVSASSKLASMRGSDRGTPHRKNTSISQGMGLAGATPPKQSSPIKSKFSAIMGGGSGRQTPQSEPKHPFAARGGRERDDLAPPSRQGTADSLASSTSSLPNRKAGTAAPSGKPAAPERSWSKTSTDAVATVNTTASSTSTSAANGPPLDLLRRQIVRFLNAEDGTIRTVNVSGVNSGVEVLELALKKFGKGTTGARHVHDSESDEDGEGRLEVDGWGVYAESDPDEDSKPLSEAGLLAICVAHRDGTAIRDGGLTIRRTRKLQNRKNMQDFFGEIPPQPMSPTSPTPFPGPRLGFTPNADRAPVSNGYLTPSNAALPNKTRNRASMISIMSGLNAPMPENVPPSPSTAHSPSSPSFKIKKKSMYNFFGHRPPSELISNHLAEYFPAAKKKDVEKARHSMLRLSMGPGGFKRDSMIGAPPASGSGAGSDAGSGRLSISQDGMPSSNRKSVGLANSPVPKASPPRRTRPGSRGTMIASPPPGTTIPEEGEATEYLTRPSISRVSSHRSQSSTDGSDKGRRTAVTSQPPFLPPFEPSKESLSDSLQAYSPSSSKPRPKSIRVRRDSAGSTRSRMSMSALSHLRSKRDRSDTASLLTVDEITAEVENRRASTITFEESEEEEEVVVPKAPTVEIVPEDEGISEESEEEESSEEESSEEESSSEESDDDDDEEEVDNEHGRAFTSTGSKRIIKWIKGALIGAGSFGSVYLGMDAHSGLLMAVKQVSLTSAAAKGEDKKNNMVEALEREIELLKELQHENIVQYLDSSADEKNLNIFLEYVPGGSVAALLSNYGAFEEALVRNFVRQILTGLDYLHERNIIHRDIKGANILVDNKGGIKISDFGISKKAELTEARIRPSLQGSVFWMAPEVVKQISSTAKADIWSVGCLVLEMLTGTHPWPTLTQMQALFRIGQFAAPEIPQDIGDEAVDFVKLTFKIDYNTRPSAKELLKNAFITNIASDDGGSGSGGEISVADAQRQMGMAMRAAGQGPAGMGKG